MRTKIALFIFLAIHPVWATAGNPPLDIPAEGWTSVFHQGHIVVEQIAIVGSPMPAYRAKGILEAPIEQILEVLSDTGAAAEWMPDLASQRVIAQVSDIELITLMVYAVPFPFADRELLLHNHLYLDSRRSALVAESVSIDHPEVAVAGDHVRAHMLSSKTWLRPLTADRTEIELAIVVDPRGRIPAFLSAIGLRRMPLKFVQALETRARTTEYPLRKAYRDLLRQLAATDRETQKKDRSRQSPHATRLQPLTLSR